MNFYISNLVSEVKKQDRNIEFSDELLEFIYNSREEIPFETSKLYGIDPYRDIEISLNDLPSIIKACSYILDGMLLQSSGEGEEWEKMLEGLIEISKEALTKGKGLVSIGD